MRTYLISNVRKAASAIFPISVESRVYATGYDQSKVPEIVALLCNRNKPSEVYPRYCSVLYKDGVIKGSGIFGGVAILNVSQLRFLFATSKCSTRYSRQSFLAQHHLPVLPGKAVRGHDPLQFVQGSSQSPPGWLQWLQLL